MVFSTPEGGHATLAFPEPVTLEGIEVLEQEAGLTLHFLRPGALRQRALDAGAIEYDSWTAQA